MNGLRLVLITRRYWPLAGSSEQALSGLVDGLRSLGALPTVVTAGFDTRWPKTVMYREVLVHRVAFPRRFRWATRRYMVALARWLRTNRPKFDLACVSRPRQDAFAAIDAFRGTGIPVVLRVENDENLDLSNLRQSGRLARRILRHCLKADAVIATDANSQRQLATIGFAPERIHCIPNGVPAFRQRTDEIRESSRAALADINHDLLAPRGTEVAVYIGPLHPSKKLRTLIHAWKHVSADWPHARLWLIGDGPQRDKLYQQIRDADLLGRVLMPGTFDEIQEILYAANMFIQPDEQPEAPLFLLHAMAAGLPVVVCSPTRQRSHVIDGVTGRVVPPGNSPALTLAITATFRDQATSHALATAAAACVKKQHSLHKMAADHLSLFQQLTSKV